MRGGWENPAAAFANRGRVRTTEPWPGPAASDLRPLRSGVRDAPKATSRRCKRAGFRFWSLKTMPSLRPSSLRMYRFPSYLGHAPHGWSRSLGGTPELTAEVSDLVLRVRSMLAAHAILYVTRAGGDAVKASIQNRYRGKEGTPGHRPVLPATGADRQGNRQAGVLPILRTAGCKQARSSERSGEFSV
jgi:hypothetical protein